MIQRAASWINFKQRIVRVKKIENEMGVACSMYVGRGEAFTGFGGETRRKEVTCESQE
jgi:hypothetical protein